MAQLLPTCTVQDLLRRPDVQPSGATEAIGRPTADAPVSPKFSDGVSVEQRLRTEAAGLARQLGEMSGATCKVWMHDYLERVLRTALPVSRVAALAFGSAAPDAVARVLQCGLGGIAPVLEAAIERCGGGL